MTQPNKLIKLLQQLFKHYFFFKEYNLIIETIQTDKFETPDSSFKEKDLTNYYTPFSTFCEKKNSSVYDKTYLKKTKRSRQRKKAVLLRYGIEETDSEFDEEPGPSNNSSENKKVRSLRKTIKNLKKIISKKND